jgi:hypothetical protein
LVDRALWHFTRGLAFVARRQADAAAREQAALARVVRSDEAQPLDSPSFPASSMLALAEQLLAGRVAGAQGDLRGMIARLEQAVAAEDALPYMEPPYWPFPTRPTLGAALLAAGDFPTAEAVFREDLQRLPRNGWGLAGLEEALRRQGRGQLADTVRRQLDTAWQNADVQLDLAWF